MTTKTAQWFDHMRSKRYARAKGDSVRPGILYPHKQLQLLNALGRTIYTTARIKGHTKRVRVWMP